jgi:serine/threonine protein kinase/WD40 repeat protein
MNPPSSERDPVERLAEEFLERYRRGDRPDLSAFIDAHPELAGQIQDLFPAIAFLEQMGGAKEASRTPVPTPLAEAATPPEYLGEYRLLREIGRGGMGVVYEAVQESLGRQVALKVLPFSSLVSPMHLERFQREARAAARLHHSNIVPVFGVGQHGGIHFYAMQFIHGQGLDAVLREVVRLRGGNVGQLANPPESERQVGNLPPSELAASVALELETGPAVSLPALPQQPASGTGPGHSPPSTQTSAGRTEFASSSEVRYFRNVARVGAQVADALAYAHRQGILHRDIKPSNLLLDTQGNIWVTDFGLAKVEGTDPLTNTGDLVGTLRYMAPERFRGLSDARSDVYGLGVTLYELLTLRPAFSETDRGQLIDQVIHGEPPRPRLHDRRIPADLETVVLKAMAKEPADRYLTAEALAEDLQRVVADRPILARRTPLREQAWRWCRRNPGLARLTSLVGFLVAVILIGSPLLSILLWKSLKKAEQANGERTEQLWVADLAHAEAQRLTNQAERRFKALDSLDKARRLLPSLKPDPQRTLTLRKEVIACLSLADLGIASQWGGYPTGSAAVAFDATLARYARGEEEGTITIRDVAGDREIVRLPGTGLGAWSLKFSPNGRFLAAGYQRKFQPIPKSFKVWDWQRGEAVVEVQLQETWGEVDFSSDSRWLAVGKEKAAVTLYDLASDKKEGKDLALDAFPAYVAFHPEGRTLAVAQPRSVKVIDLATEEVLATLSIDKDVRGMAWCDEGNLLAALGGSAIYLWEAPSFRPPAILRGHEGTVTEVAFNHRGDLLASKSDDGTVRLWDLETRRQLVRTGNVYTGCSQLQFSPDDERLGYACDGCRLWFWDVAAGRECRTLQVRYTGWQSMSGNFSPNGRLLAAGGIDGVHIWDVATGKETAFLRLEKTWSVLFAADGHELLTTGPQGLQRWPIVPADREGSTPLRIGPPLVLWQGRSLQRLAASRDGRRLVMRAGEGSALILDVQKPATPFTIEHPNLFSVAISPDGQWVATGPWFGSAVRIWDATSGTLRKELQLGGSAAVAFTPPGNALIVCTGNDYRFLDMGTWQLRHQVSKEPENTPGEVAFSRDGSMMAVRYSTRQLRLVDPATGRSLAELETPGQQTLAWHCVSPDGDRLAACSGGVIHVWDLRNIRRQLAARDLDWEPPLDP